MASDGDPTNEISVTRRVDARSGPLGARSVWRAGALALAMGALAVVLASLAIAACVSLLHFGTFLVHLGPPSEPVRRFLQMATEQLQRMGLAITLISLVLVARALEKRQLGRRLRGCLLLASGAWLGPRELEVLEGLVRGESNRSIAQRLFISEATVKTHLQHLFEKLGTKSRTAAVVEALRHGWLQLDEGGSAPFSSEGPSRRIP